MASLRVLIVEDHVALGDALRLAVDLDPGLRSVGVATTVAEALDLAVEGEADIVLTDVRLPDGDGIEATATLKELRPATRVIVLTAGVDAGALLRAAEAGASGFLSKDSRMAVILDAARRVAAGEPVLSPSALQGLLAAGRHQGPAGVGAGGEDITDDDRQLLVLMAEGLNLTSISSRLGTTHEDLRQQLEGITAALGARSPLQTLLIAAREGLLAG
ncbi:MAG: response regulator [Acidimicrobiia bacterium]